MSRVTAYRMIVIHVLVGAVAASLVLSGCAAPAGSTGEVPENAPRPTSTAAAIESTAAIPSTSAAPGSTPPDASSAATPETTPTDTTVAGIDWRRIEPSGPLHKGRSYYSFSAANTLWVGDDEEQSVLYGTTDGTSWRTLDLTKHGLPADAKVDPGTSGCSHGLVVDQRETGFTIVYYTNYGAHQGSGLLNKIWLVNIDGDTVTVEDPTKSGLEIMPPDEGGDAFRTMCIAGFTHIDGQRVAIGEGQWWKPFATGSQDAFSATQGPSGKWEVYSTKTSEMLGGGKYYARIFGVFTLGNRVGVIVDTWDKSGAFDVWTSANGRDWSLSVVPGKPASMAGLRSAVGKSGIVVAAPLKKAPGVLAVWSSPDGKSWQGQELATGERAELGMIAAVDDGYLLTAALKLFETSAWTSSDGENWEPITDLPEKSSTLGTPFPHENGFVAVSSYGIEVSGLDW
ncbi:MAG: hypothetical protein ABI382_00220 [Nakamurella sp.]